MLTGLGDGEVAADQGGAGEKAGEGLILLVASINDDVVD
jgi:hypothetical protein